jgi:hypothetical protein
MVVPSFWGRMDDQRKITPIPPEQVIAAGVESILGEKPSDKEFAAITSLTEEQIGQVLEKLAAAPPPTIKPGDVVMSGGDGAPTTAPATSATTETTTGPVASIAAPAPPAAWASGEPVFVTGLKVYKRGSGGKLDTIASAAAAPYYWPIGHDVRGAQQALGARGCTECHASGAPIFDAKVDTASLMTGASTTGTMAQWRMESTGALGAFAATYPLRWLLILIGYVSAGILLLVILSRAMQILARGATR